MEFVYPEFTSTNPIVVSIDSFLRTYEITDFVCRSFFDAILLANSIYNVMLLKYKLIKPSLHDDSHVIIFYDSVDLENQYKLRTFLRVFDETSDFVGSLDPKDQHDRVDLGNFKKIRITNAGMIRLVEWFKSNFEKIFTPKEIESYKLISVQRYKEYIKSLTNY